MFRFFFVEKSADVFKESELWTGFKDILFARRSIFQKGIHKFSVFFQRRFFLASCTWSGQSCGLCTKITSVRLKHHLFLWQGPVWLAKPEMFWPSSTEPIEPFVDREERVITHSALVDRELPWRLQTQYSLLTKLLCIIALCLQLVDRLGRKQFERSPCHSTTALSS